MSCLFPEPRLDPPEPEVYKCPVCSSEAEVYYFGQLGEIIGCENCVTTQDASDYWRDKFEEAEAIMYEEMEEGDR